MASCFCTGACRRTGFCGATVYPKEYWLGNGSLTPIPITLSPIIEEPMQVERSLMEKRIHDVKQMIKLGMTNGEIQQAYEDVGDHISVSVIEAFRRSSNVNESQDGDSQLLQE